MSVGAAHVIGSVIIKTLGLAAFYSMPVGILMLWRLLNYLIVGVLEGIILYILLKNRMIQKEIELIRGKRHAVKENDGGNKNDVR